MFKLFKRKPEPEQKLKQYDIVKFKEGKYAVVKSHLESFSLPRFYSVKYPEYGWDKYGEFFPNCLLDTLEKAISFRNELMHQEALDKAAEEEKKKQYSEYEVVA